MNEVIRFIGDYTLALNALALILFYLFTRRVTAYTVLMVGVVLIDIVHKVIAAEVKPLFGVEEYKNVIGLLWYIPFAVTNCLMVVSVAFTVKTHHLMRDRVSMTIMAFYLFLSMIQVATFFDVWVIKTAVLYDIYPAMIVSCNVFVSLLACTYTLRAGLVRFNSCILFFIRR